MTRSGSSLARTFDFGDMTTTAPPAAGAGRPGLRLALSGGLLRGADKYKALEHRRRRAQIQARRMLDLLDATDRGERG